MSRSNIIVGLDIGSSKIVSLVAQYFPEEERINVIGISNHPAKGLRKGQIVNIEEATESIIKSVEAAERMAGYSISQAFIGLSAPHITSINSQGVVAVASPNQEIVPDDVERVIEAARAVSMPSSTEILHVIPRHYTVDGQSGVVDPVGMNGIRLEVESHILMASSPALRNLKKCIDEAGVKITDFVFSGFASAEAILTPTEKELGVILVDIGGSITTMTIYHEGAPCYSKVIPVGAVNVTNDLAIGLRLSLEEAGKLKLALNENKDEDEVSLDKINVSQEKKKISIKTAIDGIVIPRLNEIFTLLREEIKESGFGGATPAGIVLTGGGAKTIGAKQSCQRILGLPVRLGQPEKVGGIADDLISPEYSSGLGLVFYGIKEKRTQKALPHRLFDLSKIRKKLPIKGAAQKVLDIFKPLLP